MRHRLSLIALVFLFVFSVTPFMSAQSSYGTVAGSITDATGAAIPGATVTIVSRETKETHTVTTNAAGGYNIPSVGSGHYDVSVSAASFEKTVVLSVDVVPSVVTSVSPNLKPGKATETVEVSGATELLQTESGEQSASISGKEIAELPISGLNPTALVLTLPGVTAVTVGSGGNGPNFSVNGSRPRANNYLIEGQDDNDAGLTGQALKPSNTESFDSANFLLNGYSAEFGYAGGGIANIVFKSGTNQWHGSIFDRILNSSLNAIDHQNRLNGVFTKSKTRENVYGGTIGFPILHNKLFFFGAYEQDHFRSSSLLSILTVPTVNGYAVLNQYLANPRIKNLVTAYGGLQGAVPGPNYAAYSKSVDLGPDPVTGIARGTVQYGGVQRSIGRLTNSSELDLKGDYQATQADKIQLRFIRTYSLVPYDVGNFPSQLPFFDTNQGGPAENAGIVATHIFSPNLVNEARLSYGRINFVFDLRPDTYSNPLAIGPTVAITGVTGYGIPTNVPQGRGHNTYQLQDALSYTHGKHTMKFGFDIQQVRVKDEVPFIFYGSIGYVASTGTGATPNYTALGNYFDDYSGFTTSTGQSLTKYFGSNVARPILTTQSYYAQDHWKLLPNLSFDFGLRYEYQGAPFNYLAAPATDLSSPFTSYATPVKMNPQYKNFAPRLGFAYQPSEGSKLVVRGAFGVYYDHSFTNIDDNIQASTPNAATPILYGSNAASSRGTAAWSTLFPTLNQTPQPLNSQTTIAKNLKAPLTYQYNLSIQRLLPGGFTATVGYAGSVSHHLYSLDALNPVIAATGLRVNTTRGSIAAFTNDGDSNYNAIELSVEHKFRQSFAFQGAFTYAKDLDSVSDPYTSGNLSAYPEIEATLPTGGAPRGRDYGLSAYDHRIRGVGTAVYHSPNFHWSGAKAILARIVNNYSISAIPSFQSGSVYNVQTGFDINNDGITNDRPVLTNASAPITTFSVLSTDFYKASTGAAPGVYCDGSYVLNAKNPNPVTGVNDAFCHPVSLNQMHYYIGTKNTQNNTIGRDAGITPGNWNVDASVQREFKIGQHQGISFRAESFNVLNHANTGIPSFTLYGSTLQPNAVGYTPGTFANYGSTQAGARNLRFFLRYAF